jgi:hypothetical protein
MVASQTCEQLQDTTRVLPSLQGLRTMLPRTVDNCVALHLNALDKHAPAEFRVIGGADAHSVRASVRFVVADMTISRLKDKTSRGDEPAGGSNKRARM